MNYYNLEKIYQKGSEISVCLLTEDNLPISFCVPCCTLVRAISDEAQREPVTAVAKLIQLYGSRPLLSATVFTPDGKSYPIHMVNGRYEPYKEPCILNLWKLGEILGDCVTRWNDAYLEGVNLP